MCCVGLIHREPSVVCQDALGQTGRLPLDETCATPEVPVDIRTAARDGQKCVKKFVADACVASGRVADQLLAGMLQVVPFGSLLESSYSSIPSDKTLRLKAESLCCVVYCSLGFHRSQFRFAVLHHTRFTLLLLLNQDECPNGSTTPFCTGTIMTLLIAK
jgi:hypothetical protein